MSKRWIAPLVLVVLNIGLLVWIWSGEQQRQDKVIMTMVTEILIGFLLYLWFVFFSGFARKIRFGVGGVLLLLGLGLAFSVEIRDVTGDIVPELAFKWSPRPDERLTTEFEPPTTSALATSGAEDFPRFLGPNGDLIMPGPQLAKDWSTTKPQELWRIEIGAGWSGFAIAGQLAVTQEQRGESEMVTAYALESGELLWTQGVEGVRYSTTLGGAGPRATPTIVGDRVYTLGATGLLHALNLTDGAVLWSQDLVANFGGRMPEWGYAGSPLVENGRVIVAGGGDEGRSLLAFDAESGDLAWSGGSDKASYATPVSVTLAGRPQIVMLYEKTLAGHDPETGEQLWETLWGNGMPSCANPVPVGENRLLVSAGYGMGAKFYEFGADQSQEPEELWYSLRLKAKFANFFVHDGVIFGLDDGIMTAVSLEDGQRLWKRGRYGHGQLLVVGDVILLQSESGDLNLLAMDSETHRELGKIPVLNGKAWNTMALSGDRLLMRNHREAVLLKLPTQ